MKMIKKTTAVLASIAAVVAMTACSSDSSSGGGGGGSSALEIGGFIKSFEGGGGASFGGMFGTNLSRYQLLYTPAEISGSGNMANLGFQLNSDLVADVSCPNVTIKMGHTSIASLTSTYDSNVETGSGSRMEVATDLNLTIPAGSSGDYFNVPLDVSFHYNGVDNLVVEIVRSAACDASVSVKGTPAAYNASVFNTSSDVAATGTASAAQIHMKAIFEGGVDKLEKSGTSNNFWPFTSQSAHTQNLYTVADINGSGPITGLAFQMNQPSTEQTFTVSVKLGHTTLTDLTGTFADNSSDLKAVATDINFTVPAGLVAGDWFWVPLNGSFNYNGTDNLLVDIEVPVGTGDIDLRYTSSANLVRAAANVGDLTTADLGGTEYHVKFRFNGATTDVITDGANSTGFVFPATGGTSRQALYRSTELGTAGMISKVSCRMQSATSTLTEYPNYLVTMGHTTLAQLTSTFADNFDDATVVYDGNFTVPAGLVQGDWIEIPVTPFAYDGKRNLVVQFAGDGGGTGHSCMLSSADSTRYPVQVIGTSDRTSLTATVTNDSKFDTRLWLAP